jgi:coenzyme F420-reducing hydrogenase alpha subunit
MTHKLTQGDHVLKVDQLARVEGEGAMHVVVRDGLVADVELQIFEPPRFFEAFLRGRAWTEPPDITARICGICPVAYQMSSCLAIEDACGVTVPDELRLMRRLLYCGEWIESHALHVFLLHAPDFLGYQGAIEMAADHGAVVEQGLRLKKAGNALMTLVGGRAVHPVNVRVGGFYRLPTVEELRGIRPTLVRARDDAVETVRLVAGFEFPDLVQPYEYLALRSPHGYPLEGGSVVTSAGRAFEVADFGTHIVEEHVARSNALHAHINGVDRTDSKASYVVGPLARYTLNHDQLGPLARELAAEAGLRDECRNPFQSIVVRAVELVHATDEALSIIDAWDGAPAPSVDVPPRAGIGHGATEAPRGLIYHRYELAEDGTILDATIIPPTSQNQASIEADLRAFVQERLDLPRDELVRQCEQAIRNYDPCISCATHFLDLTMEEQ